METAADSVLSPRNVESPTSDSMSMLHGLNMPHGLSGTAYRAWKDLAEKAEIEAMRKQFPAWAKEADRRKSKEGSA